MQQQNRTVVVNTILHDSRFISCMKKGGKHLLKIGFFLNGSTCFPEEIDPKEHARWIWWRQLVFRYLLSRRRNASNTLWHTEAHYVALMTDVKSKWTMMEDDFSWILSNLLKDKMRWKNEQRFTRLKSSWLQHSCYSDWMSSRKNHLTKSLLFSSKVVKEWKEESDFWSLQSVLLISNSFSVLLDWLVVFRKVWKELLKQAVYCHEVDVAEEGCTAAFERKERQESSVCTWIIHPVQLPFFLPD